MAPNDAFRVIGSKLVFEDLSFFTEIQFWTDVAHLSTNIDQWVASKAGRHIWDPDTCGLIMIHVRAPARLNFKQRETLQFCSVRQTLAQVFSYEFCEISKNILFTEHLWTTASIRPVNKSSGIVIWDSLHYL